MSAACIHCGAPQTNEKHLIRPAPWGEAHQREALRRTYEIAAELVAEGRQRDARWLIEDATTIAGTEHEWRFDLCDRPGAGFDAARVEREVARVRALAERRMVRNPPVWRGESGEERTTRDEAAKDKSHGGAALTRIARIRRVL